MTGTHTDTAEMLFPLKIGPTHRTLVERGSKPFIIHGDSAWSLITALSEEEVELDLANRAAKGFNALIVNLIEHKFNGVDTLTAALTAGGSTLMAYLPEAREIVVDLGKVYASQVRVVWFDPRSGTPEEPAFYPASGPRSLPHPARAIGRCSSMTRPSTCPFPEGNTLNLGLPANRSIGKG